MHKFKIFYLNEKYYNHLFDNKLKEMLSKELRPHIQLIGINLNGIDYLIPLTSDKLNKYKASHKYSLLIKNDNKTFDVLKINKMIPIINHKDFIYEPTINELVENHGYKNKLLEELKILNQPQNQKKVYELANEVYHKRQSATKEQLDPKNKKCDWNLITAVDFKQAELLMMEFAFKQKIREGYIPSDWAHETWRFSELNEYCEQNSIDEKNRFGLLIEDSELYELCLIKHPNGIIEMVYEYWGDELDEETEKHYAPEIIFKEEVETIKDVMELLKQWNFDEYVPRKDIIRFLDEEEQKQITPQSR